MSMFPVLRTLPALLKRMIFSRPNGSIGMVESAGAAVVTKVVETMLFFWSTPPPPPPPPPTLPPPAALEHNKGTVSDARQVGLGESGRHEMSFLPQGLEVD